MMEAGDYQPMDSFTDDQLRDFLELRLKFALRGERDRADVIGVRFDEDGTLITRPLTFDDLCSWIERKLVGEIE